VPCAYVLAEALYGSDKSVRVMLEQRQQPHVLAVRSNERLMAGSFQTRTAAEIADAVAQPDWQRLAAGEGAKGPRLYDWARVHLFWLQQPGQRFDHGLLVRRSLRDASERAYYVVFAPAEVSLAQLAGVAGLRWTIETCFEIAKDELGLDCPHAQSCRLRLPRKHCWLTAKRRSPHSTPWLSFDDAWGHFGPRFAHHHFYEELRVNQVCRRRKTLPAAPTCRRSELDLRRRKPVGGRFNDQPGESILVQSWRLTSSTFIRFERPSTVDLATTIPFAAGLTPQGTGPFSEGGVSQPSDGAVTRPPAFPYRVHGNPESSGEDDACRIRPVLA
jgi:hypothetical protein